MRRGNKRGQQAVDVGGPRTVGRKCRRPPRLPRDVPSVDPLFARRGTAPGGGQHVQAWLDGLPASSNRRRIDLRGPTAYHASAINKIGNDALERS